MPAGCTVNTRNAPASNSEDTPGCHSSIVVKVASNSEDGRHERGGKALIETKDRLDTLESAFSESSSWSVTLCGLYDSQVRRRPYPSHATSIWRQRRQDGVSLCAKESS